TEFKGANTVGWTAPSPSAQICLVITRLCEVYRRVVLSSPQLP
ncbi:unnamed protein product, partial [Allacma fusca]